MGILTHLDETGAARMVDVTDKPVTDRVARAGGRVLMRPETLRLIAAGNVPKGDVLATARLAGLMAAKRTSDLIPLCHPLPISSVEVSFRLIEDLAGTEGTEGPSADLATQQRGNADVTAQLPSCPIAQLPNCPIASLAAVEIETRVRVSGQTGVEMEALTAAAVAALTIYDMCKAVDRNMVVSDVRLLEKTGGKSDYHREE